MRPKTRNRLGCVFVLLLIFGFPAACTYKYSVADELERRCGIWNLFKWDYSAELADGIKFSVDGPDVHVDFTALKRWKRVCLVSMYEDGFYGPLRPNPWRGGSYSEIGRWQCHAGMWEDALGVMLVNSDGGTLARQVKPPPHVLTKLGTNYRGEPWMESYFAAGFRQCADIDSAVAQCARLNSSAKDGCYLLFRSKQAGE